MMKEHKENLLEEKQKELFFSGAFYAKKGDELLKGSCGFSNRSEKILNELDTRFSIASGCKIFTAIAICILVEEGKLSFDSKLKDCVDVQFPYFHEDITIHHLLTHTSGVPDYFNEEVIDDFESLWKSYPMYNIRSPKDFLPLFQNEKMQAAIGSSFQYNNSGYILLGLIVENVAECSFTEFVEKRIFRKAGMERSGYFEMDRLPEQTALGYIEEPDGTWKTNVYSLPAKGGPDGGAYVTAEDIVNFWQALMDHRLLSEEMTKMLLEPREIVNEEQNIYYGYSGYMLLNDDQKVVKYIQMGYDPGANFRAVYYPVEKATIVVCSNKSDGAFELLKEIESII